MVFTSTTPFRWDDGDVDGAVGGGVVLLIVASRRLVFGPFRFFATYKDGGQHEKTWKHKAASKQEQSRARRNVKSPATKGKSLMQQGWFCRPEKMIIDYITKRNWGG